MNSNLEKEKYYIFIDESGSINSHSIGIFEVAFLIVSNSNLKKATKYYRNQIS
jgi:hypothetical protein